MRPTGYRLSPVMTRLPSTPANENAPGLASRGIVSAIGPATDRYGESQLP